MMGELVLVGGGHAHVQVLRRLAMAPLPDTRITVVVDRPLALYSGMVPGVVAGQYRLDEAQIDVHPLARRAGARVVTARAVRVDPDARTVHVEGRPPIPWDLCSLNVGSTVAGIDVHGVAEHALATRPIGAFVRELDRRLSGAGERPRRVVVVGAGAGGVELAFALQHRLGPGAEVTLLEAGPRVLPGARERLARRVVEAARERGIRVRTEMRAVEAEAERLRVEGGESLPFDLLVWVAGAAPPALVRDSRLPTDERGFVLVDRTLRVVGHEGLFAAGDCAVPQRDRWVPRAGVYAVRQGPVLADNLEAAVRGWTPRRYRPQKDFLTLLNLSDGEAIGAKWGVVVQGRRVFRLKDRIDRRFVERFTVLGPAGEPTAAAPPMEMPEMICGGCAAKVGVSALDRALEGFDGGTDPSVVLGVAEREDVAAARTDGGEVVISNLDAFRAFTDDPWLVGRVAAVNAMGDLWAKGVRPRHALALVALPDEEEDEARVAALLRQVLDGARAALEPDGVTLLGGHTTTAPELMVGFTVNGYLPTPEGLLRTKGLRPGNRLILTRALGTGVLLHADPRGLVRGPWFQAAVASMTRSYAAASRAMVAAGATGATDVTGFGLAGHLGEMLRASGVGARLTLSALPALPGAVELLARGERSTFHAENARALQAVHVSTEAADRPEVHLLADPQTAGGLLFGVPAEAADEALERVREAGEAHAAIIGEVTPVRGQVQTC